MEKMGWLKKLLRWQLRTLLALTALIAIGLALYLKWIEPYRIQFNAREKLESVGGQLGIEEAEPAWMESLVGKERFHRVVSFRNRGRTIRDQDLAPLIDLPHLQRLYLEGTSIGDESMRYVGRLKTLQRLSLWRTRITDEGLPYIAHCSALRVLDIHSNCVTDEGLVALERLQNMRQLTLGGAVCGPGLKSIAKLPVLAKLDLSRTRVSYDDLALLAGSPIETLRMSDRVPASVIEHLCELPRLRELQGQILGVDDQAVELLSNCTDLRSVSLVGSRLTDAGVAHLTRLSRLEKLTLDGDLTDITLDRIASMNELNAVNISGRFSIDALNRLQARRPGILTDVRTLLPNEYYEVLPQKAPHNRSLIKMRTSNWRPLIEVRMYGRNRINDQVGLQAIVNFPATVLDLTNLPAVRDRLDLIMLPLPDDASFTDDSFDWSLDGLDQFPNLRTLTIRGISNSDLARFKKLNGLLQLTIYEDSLTDEDLKLLQLPDSLQILEITSPWVTGSGIQNVRSRHANDSTTHQLAIERKSVNLNPTNITPEQLALSGSPRRLYIRNSGVHKRAWQVDNSLATLEDLTLRSATDQDLRKLEFCPALTELTLDHSSISDNAFVHFAHCPRLKRVSAAAQWHGLGPWLTGRELRRLQACPELEYLNLTRTHLRPQYLADLVPLQHLMDLRLADTRIGDDSCQHLARLPSLFRLDLQRTDITDAGLKILANCPSLDYLDISWTGVTGVGLRYLPGCETLKTVKMRVTETPQAEVDSLRQQYPSIRWQTR